MEDIIVTQAQLDEALDAWEKEYKPITNHLDNRASWSGWMFETFGEELKFVLSQPDEHVWTWNDCDGKTFLNAGYSVVNRLGYLITEKPWTDPCHVLQIDAFSEHCDECGEGTDNGAGHWQEELGDDHPQAEDRLCTNCYESIKERS